MRYIDRDRDREKQNKKTKHNVRSRDYAREVDLEREMANHSGHVALPSHTNTKVQL